VNREERLRKVVPGASPDLIADLAARPAAEVDQIVALARQARRDAIAHEAERRRQQKQDARTYNHYDEGQLTGRNLRMISAAGSRAGNSLDALAGLVEARDAIAGRIALAVPLLRARGYSDPEIAATLGTTRQAVGQAFGRKRRFTPGPAGTGGAA